MPELFHCRRYDTAPDVEIGMSVIHELTCSYTQKRTSMQMMQVKRITVKAQTSMSQLKTMNVFETIPPAVQMHSMGIHHAISSQLLTAVRLLISRMTSPM